MCVRARACACVCVCVVCAKCVRCRFQAIFGPPWSTYHELVVCVCCIQVGPLEKHRSTLHASLEKVRFELNHLIQVRKSSLGPTNCQIDCRSFEIRQVIARIAVCKARHSRRQCYPVRDQAKSSRLVLQIFTRVAHWSWSTYRQPHGSASMHLEAALAVEAAFPFLNACPLPQTTCHQPHLFARRSANSNRASVTIALKHLAGEKCQTPQNTYHEAEHPALPIQQRTRSKYTEARASRAGPCFQRSAGLFFPKIKGPSCSKTLQSPAKLFQSEQKKHCSTALLHQCSLASSQSNRSSFGDQGYVSSNTGAFVEWSGAIFFS